MPRRPRMPGHVFGLLLLHVVDPDVIDEELVRQLDLLDVTSPVSDLIAYLDVERHLAHTTRLAFQVSLPST